MASEKRRPDPRCAGAGKRSAAGRKASRERSGRGPEKPQAFHGERARCLYMRCEPGGSRVEQRGVGAMQKKRGLKRFAPNTSGIMNARNKGVPASGTDTSPVTVVV